MNTLLRGRPLFLPRDASALPAMDTFNPSIGSCDPSTSDSGIAPGASRTDNLHETDNWLQAEDVRKLLSSSDSPITPYRLLELLRSIRDSSAALHVLDWCRRHGLEAASASHAPFAFQAIFELAARENKYGNLPRLKDLLLRSIDHGYILTQDSAALLVRSFTTGHIPSDALLAFRSLDPSLRCTNLCNHVISALLRSPDPKHQAEALSLTRNMLSPGFHCLPDTTTCSIIFSTLLRRNQPADDQMLHLIVGMAVLGCFPTDTYQFTKVVITLSRAGCVDKAWDLVHAIKNAGGTVHAPIWNALLTGLSKNRDTSRMKLVFSEMEASGLENVVTYGIIINHLAKSHNINLALQLFDKMTSPNSGVIPDTVIFNNLIDGLCKVGRTREGLCLLNHMKTHHCDPNTITFNALIDGFCKIGDIDTAHELNDRMSKEGVLPNIITLNTLISGMCRNGRVSGALNFFHEKKLTRENAKGNAITYCILIGAFLHANNVSKAMELFDEMIEKGHFPDSVTYFTMISGLSMAGRIDDARSMASAMRRDGFQLDTKSYNILIAGFGKKKKLNEAAQLFGEMSEAGIKPDVVTYNTLIDAYCKAGDFPMAETLLTNMTDGNCKPSLVTYGTLIQGFCKKGDHDGAKKIFQSMKDLHVEPNAVIYNILIGSFCSGGEIGMAISHLDQMRKNGVSPNVITYNTILKGLCENNISGKAFEVIDQMKAERCSPNARTVEILTGWLPAIGETKRLRCFMECQNAAFS
ncbi:hypothetical protein KSP40_PGU000986 [Platanthera guangdongensis]|uniref:Pentatricopeptide repeat-containing protein n=1 Tax=Platanthera guangdongensis TaxID=2320717 RepID=A0ABR2MRN5_9ASPA